MQFQQAQLVLAGIGVPRLLLLQLQLQFWQIQAALPGIEGAGLLLLQFGQMQAPLPGIGCARVVAVAVAVAVLADPTCSGEEGEFQGQPRPGPCSFDRVWDWQVTQVQFQRAQLV